MRRKFKIMYPYDHPDRNKCGKRYRCPEKTMLVMNTSGVVFQFCQKTGLTLLSKILPKYDVVWVTQGAKYDV